MRVAVRRRVRFSAAHSYENMPAEVVSDTASLGLARSRSVHGHNYVVDLTCKGVLDRRTGMVVNITDVDAVLQSVVRPLHETFLEQDHPEVAWGIPTTENLALWIWQQCDGRIKGADLAAVRVREDDFLWSEYRGGDERLVYVTRSYEFASAHRLHSPHLSDEENLVVFGKCNNPNGHGHNYGLEVTIRARTDPRTGLACNIGDVDAVVHSRIVDRFDHKHLNLDVPDFKDTVPTSENLAVVIWGLLRPEIGDALHKVCVRETERNYFEYMGED